MGRSPVLWELVNDEMEFKLCPEDGVKASAVRTRERGFVSPSDYLKNALQVARRVFG